jgi:hypothetical protein
LVISATRPAWRQLIELAHLPLEALAFEQHVLGIGLEFLALARQRAPGLVGRRHFLHLGGGSGSRTAIWLSSSARWASA